MKIFLAIAITVVIIIIQNFLSTRKQWQLGAILPVLAVIFFFYNFYIVKSPLNVNTIRPFAILFVILLLDWIDGRIRFKKKEKEETETELNKIKAHDLND